MHMSFLIGTHFLYRFPCMMCMCFYFGFRTVQFRRVGGITPHDTTDGNQLAVFHYTQ